LAAFSLALEEQQAKTDQNIFFMADYGRILKMTLRYEAVFRIPIISYLYSCLLLSFYDPMGLVPGSVFLARLQQQQLPEKSAGNRLGNAPCVFQ